MTERHSHPAGARVDVGSPSTDSALNRLLEAHRVITADLSPRAMLDRIASCAATLTGGDFAELSVIGTSGIVARCATHNVSAADRHRFQDVRNAKPGGSPAQRARLVGGDRLLGATLLVGGEPFAELYAGTRSRFTEDAEHLLHALAELAGTALQSALLYEEAHRSKDWLLASGEIARALLSDAEGDMLLEVALRALHVAEADSAGLFLPDGDGRLRVAVATGRGAGDFRGALIDADNSALGRAILRGESLLVDDMAQVMRPGFVNVHEYGAVMAAPLVDARGVRGSVVLCRTRGRLPFSARDLDLASTFADQLALALEMDDARLRGEWVKVLEDRHRIAHELHDSVIQRLFATGMGLQSILADPLPPETARRLGRHITELDETIDQIRSRVFDLREADGLPVEAASPSRFPRVAADEIDAMR